MPTTDQQNWATKTINGIVHSLALTILLFSIQSYLLPLRQQWVPKAIDTLGIDYRAINWALSVLNVIANDEMATLKVIAIMLGTLACCYLVMLKITDLIAGIATLRHHLIRTVLTIVLSLTGYITGIPILFLNTVIQVWESWLQPLYWTAERWSMRKIRAFKQWIISRYDYHKELWDDELRAEGRTEGRVEGIAEGRAEGIAEGRAFGHAEGVAEGRTEGRAEGTAETLDRMVAAGKLTPQERDEFLKKPAAENPGNRQPYLNPE